jgi:predicted GNAT superfamily acetyltransferase
MFRDHPVTFRPLETRQECLACVSLQREIWGQDFVGIVPATILMVSQRVGGVVSGAFDTKNHLIGFVFGISGMADDMLTHWSHMLAVRPEVRRFGLGRRLKLYQRTQLLERGIRVASWSYDPLMATNARFNLNTLGAYPTTYIDDMYGDIGSTLNSGLDTDRLIVKWHLDNPDVERRIASKSPITSPSPAPEAPIMLPPDSTDRNVTNRSIPNDDLVWIAVPSDIVSLKATDLEEARQWQRSVREAFHECMNTGYRVVDFCSGRKGEPSAYALTTEPLPTPDN